MSALLALARARKDTVLYHSQQPVVPQDEIQRSRLGASTPRAHIINQAVWLDCLKVTLMQMPISTGSNTSATVATTSANDGAVTTVSTPASPPPRAAVPAAVSPSFWDLLFTPMPVGSTAGAFCAELESKDVRSGESGAATPCGQESRCRVCRDVYDFSPSQWSNWKALTPTQQELLLYVREQEKWFTLTA